MEKMEKLDDIEFKLKKGTLKVRSATNFREIIHLKNMRKEEMKQILYEKMGVRFNG